MEPFVPYYRALNSGIAPVDAVANTGISGLAAIGNLLDLPGSSVRDVLAFKNPLDQWMTPFSGANRTSGRDLLRNTGLISQKDTWGNFLPGLALEVGLDPLLPLTFFGKALTPAGKALSKVGALETAKDVGRFKGMGPAMTRRTVTPQAVADQAQERLLSGLRPVAAEGDTVLDDMARQSADYAQRFPQYQQTMGQLGRAQEMSGLGDNFYQTPIGGDFGFGNPFADPVTTFNVPGYAQTADTLGAMVTGGREVRLPASVLGRLPESMQKTFDQDYSNPAGTTMRALFDASVRDTTQRLVQPFASRASREMKAAKVGARQTVNDMFSQMMDIPDIENIRGEDLRYAFETKDFAGLPEQLRPIVTAADERLKSLRERALNAGLKAEQLDDLFVDYFPRYVNKEYRKATGGGRAMGAQDPTHFAREAYLKNIEGGTRTINEIIRDDGFRQAVQSGDPAVVKAWLDESEIGQKIPDMSTDLLSGQPLPDGAIPSQKTARELFAEKALEIPKDATEGGMFTNYPLMDLLTKMTATDQSIRMAETIEEMLRTPDILTHTGKAERKSIRDVLMTAGMDANEKSPVVRRIMESMKEQLADPKQKADLNPAKVLRYKISGELADDIGKYMKSFQSPEPVGKVLDAIDKFTNYFKFGVTAWPSFHSRNFASGQVQNMVMGAWSRGAFYDSWNMLRGKETKGLSKIKSLEDRWKSRGGTGQFTETAAAQVLREIEMENSLIKQQGETFAGVGDTGQVTDQIPVGMEEYTSQFAGGYRGDQPFQMKDVVQQLRGRQLGGSPDTDWTSWWGGVRGVGEEPVRNPISAASDTIGEAVETMNRRVPLIALLKKGMDPHQAAEEVKRLQVDYSSESFTRFQRDAVTRAVPFGKFIMGATPVTFGELAQRPAGPLGQLIKATAAGSDSENPGTPEHIAQTAAIEFPDALQPGDGSRRYLSGFGLMHESPLGFIGADPVSNPGKFAQTLGLEVLSTTSPIIKGFIEGATGESLFQRGPFGGRELDSLDPPIGRTLNNIKQMFGSESTEPVRYFGSNFIEPLVSNSPLAKVASTARQLTDPRKDVITKSINALTGVKITDVSPQSSLYSEKNRILELLQSQGGNTFSNVYFKPSQLGAMPEDQLMLHQALIGRLKEIDNKLGTLRNQVP